MAHRPTRSADYAVWRLATTRWADDDVYGHMNNARYFELIDTAVNAHLAEATGVDIRSLPAVGVVAEVGCRYFREIGYPAPGRPGARRRTGRHLLGGLPHRALPGRPRGEGALAAAEGRFVHVYVDNTGDGAPVRPIPDEIRGAVVPLLRDWRGVGMFHWRCCGSTAPRPFPDEGAPSWDPSWSCCCCPRARAGRHVYAAYPYRGEETPVSPLLGRAMRRGVDSLPTLPGAQDRPGAGARRRGGADPTAQRARPGLIGRP